MSSNMDNYRKIEIVGKGSFGCAVLVQSVVDRKYYIMKIIDVSKMDRKQKEEALNEVTFLKAMRHPYIITYRESFMDKNRYLCIVMDYAEGGDMYSKIAKQKKINKGFPESQILDWFVQIALAMKYVHDRKILHRDLKTQNIFLTANGDIKIGDFARVLQDTYDCAQTAIGTPYYLSPEICQEKPYNQKSDIWSLGCILYELVTLKHAFDANSMKGLVLKILRGSYPTIPSNYSPELKDLISEMLTKDPAKRPSVKKILEKDFLSSRINALVSNTIVKHELGNTLLKKVTGNGENISPSPSISSSSMSASSISSSSQKEVVVNSVVTSQRESLVDRSNTVLNQVDNRKSSKDNSILKGIDDEKKLTPINALSKKTNNYLPSENDKQNFPPSSISVSSSSIFKEEVTEKKRSSSTSRGQEPEYMKKLENVKTNNLPSQRKYEEEKQTSSVNTSLNISTSSQRQPSSSSSSSNIRGSPYVSKEVSKENNKPGMIFSNSTTQNQLTKEEEEQQQQLNNLIKDAKELEKRKLNPDKKDANDDDYFEEDEKSRVRSNFLDLDGKEIPGCGDKETISYRIEALRYYLEKQIGEDPFYAAYKYIQSPQSGSNNDDAVLTKLVGKTKMKFVTMIYQLIVCEDSYYGDE